MKRADCKTLAPRKIDDFELKDSKAARSLPTSPNPTRVGCRMLEFCNRFGRASILATGLSALLLASTQGQAVEKPQEITLDWLLTEGDNEIGGSDHVGCMQKILERMKPRTMMEFGLGYATKYFLETCKRVISVEVVTHGYGPQRIQRFVQFYKDYSNWTPVAFFSGYRGDVSWAPYKYMASDAVYLACSYQCATTLSYQPIDPTYIKDLTDFIGNLSRFHKIEVALIHPMLFLRGDIVEICFGKIPVIVAHNTAPRAQGIQNDPFGFTRIKTSPDYEEIYVATPRGTTIWVSKKPELQPLIDELTEFAKLSASATK